MTWAPPIGLTSCAEYIVLDHPSREMILNVVRTWLGVRVRV